MGDSKNALRAYIALARGPGTIKQATEGAFEEALPDDVEYEPEPTFARDLSTSGESSIDEDEVDVESLHELPPSPMFVRLLEELSSHVTPIRARHALEQSLAQAGVHPDEATSLDLRSAVVDALPGLLGRMLSTDDLELVLERLETALTHAIVPPRIEPKRED